MDRQEETSELNNYEVTAGRGLINVVFSWSLEDVLNPHLHQNQGRRSSSIFFDNEKCYLSGTFPAMCSDLNDSKNKCNLRNTIKQIWGPPGTGKTKTVIDYGKIGDKILFGNNERLIITELCAGGNIG
ncbi:hypothetical protein D8674_025048 [Pyrus ussuriensis x Pyrus communis]|uniref:Uncharacterized protein n=1 Tax=Pyrus ussuriensis x Pyrus communis TaxID=2448454 RepID=A0A5N5H4K1_9ROSA|nr:hypothetical protein D8674_025048 [Pyrus ussuriensis x Pyrus communis]